jgi:asparagine synthase (glutamine-hydrolysing)
MCGIAGLMVSRSTDARSLHEVVEAMSDRLVHRGPDDAGIWADPDAGVAFGFRRLSIIDLSDAGHQPMRSASGRFTIVFNGEVYNYVEIREELRRGQVHFRGHSDTEVILAAFERWGVKEAVHRFVGMFAIAVWDADARSLSLIRDRLGIKPLYYSHHNGRLVFASELKAFMAVPQFDREIDPAALAAFLRYLYVPAPQTIFRTARKLLPGHILTVREVAAPSPSSEAYWSLESVYAAAKAAPFAGSDEEVVSELRRLLSDAVRLRMRSDVPMGALLSGGLDSSTVVALMQENASQPTRTFSIGFPGTPHDEAAHAARIARVLGTQHTEMSVTASEALATVPLLPELFDEPFADPSQIPTYLVCKLARQAVTVALSGDGADELFAGYERYLQGERLIRHLRGVPHALRRVASAGLKSSTTEFWDRAYRGVAPVFDRRRRHRLAGEKIRKLGELLGERTPAAMYRSLLSAAWKTPPLEAASTHASRVDEMLAANADLPLLDGMMLIDQQTYLADDLLAKVDRASMAVSLEARVPLIDHRVVEFSWRLDRHHKVRDGRGKWALRQVLYAMIDRELVDRPKTGFSVPLGSWLRGPLRAWAGDLLFSNGSSRDMVLSEEPIRAAWASLQRGSDDSAWALWAVLMFVAWQDRWRMS